MSGPLLLVHDDLATIAAVRRVLSAEGYEVVLATSAADAIISFGQRTPALVLLGPAVDGGRGASVHAEIRGLPEGQAVRFLLLGGGLEGVDDAQIQILPLPMAPDALRAALQKALATDGGGWELQSAAQTREEPAPRLPAGEEGDPWRVADARTSLAPAEPLADQLFGDLRAEDPGTPGARVPSGATPLSHRHLPSARAPQDTDPDALPPGLAEIPVEAPPLEPSEHTGPLDLARPKTQGAPLEPPTLDRPFDELDLPPSELERLVHAEEARTGEARERVAEVLFSRDQAESRRDALRQAFAESRRARAAAEADIARAEALQKQLEAEVAGLQAHLDGATAARQEAEAGAEQAAQAVAELERRRAAAQAKLATEQQARLQAEQTLQETRARQEALSGSVADAESSVAAERDEVEALERRREALEGSARADAAKSSAAQEQASLHRARLAELELARRAAEARAREQAALRAEAEHQIEALLQEQARQSQLLAAAEQAEAQGRDETLALTARKAELSAESERLKQARAVAEGRAQSLQAERAQLQAAVRKAEQQVAVENNQLQTLQRTGEAAEIKLGKVSAAHGRLQAELDEARAKAAEGQAEAARLSAELAARETELGALMQAREAAVAEARRTTAALEKLAAALAQRERDRDKLAAAHAAATAQLAGLRSELESHENRQSDATRQHADQRRALRELQQELAQATDAVASLTAERDAASSELERVEQARAQLEAELQGLHGRQRDLALELRTQERTRQAGLQELARQREALDAALTQLSADAEGHGQALGELEAKRVGLAAELEALKARLHDEEAQAQARAAERAALQAQLEALAASRDAAQARAEALAAERAAFQKFVAEAEGELSRSPRPQTEPELPRPALPAAVEPRATRTAPAPRRRMVAAGRFQPPAPLRPLPEHGALNVIDPAALPPFPEGPVEPRAPSWGEGGDLAEGGAASFFARAFAERITGRVDVALRDGARALYFEEGRLVAALSSAPGDRLESLAQRDGLITRAHERALRAESADLAPRQLAVRMVELQLIKGTELYQLVRRHMEQVAYALFSEERTRYTFTAEVAPPEHRVALPVHPLAFMLEGVRRKGDFDRLNAALGGPSALVRLREGAPELTDLGLAPRERRFVQLIDGLRTIEELIFASGLEPPAAVKLLHGLSAAGVVEVWPNEAPPEDAGAAPGLQIDLSRVHAKYEQVKSGDYFEILGVEREATGYEVRAAFERLSREFHPMRFAAIEDAALPARLEEIGRMVAEAADVLTDDHTRASYARNLAEGR